MRATFRIQRANVSLLASAATLQDTQRSSEETVHVAQFHHHGLQLGVILHGRPAVLPAEAWQKGGQASVVYSHATGCPGNL